jgi:hypothetical protein
MSASIIQRKAAFATVVGSGSVAVTLDNAISAGSELVIAAAICQNDGSNSAAPSVGAGDNLGNGYGMSPSYVSSGQGFFTNAYLSGTLTPQTGARTYTLNFTAPAGESSYTFLAGICIYELSGADTAFTNESASQGLSGFHKIADLSAAISGLGGGTYGNLLLGIGAFTVSDLTDANQIVAGTGWTLDGRSAVNGTFGPMAIVFESQLVGPASNPAVVFTGSANSDELDGTILVAAYTLTSALPGGGGGGSVSTGPVFLGSVRVVGSAPAGRANPFLGTVKVVGNAPAGDTNPYLGQVVEVASTPANDTNPSLGEVVIVGSAPAGDPDPFLGSVINT